MSLELFNNYRLSTYEKSNVTNKSTNEKTDSTTSSKDTSKVSSDTDAKSSSVDEYYKKLCTKYPNLKFQVGLGTLKANSVVPNDFKGFGNIRIDAAYLKKAASDPKVAEQLEKNLDAIPSGEAWLKSMYSMSGMKLVSNVTGFDAKGNCISGSNTIPMNLTTTKAQKNVAQYVNSNTILGNHFEKLNNQKSAQAKRLALMVKNNASIANLQKRASKSYGINTNSVLSDFNMSLLDSEIK